MRRTKNVIRYHGRRGHPIIHKNGQGRRYIMVRKAGGGVKRLYAGSKYKPNVSKPVYKKLVLK